MHNISAIKLPASIQCAVRFWNMGPWGKGPGCYPNTWVDPVMIGGIMFFNRIFGVAAF